MRWVKKGLIYSVDNNYDWMKTHAQVPIVNLIDNNRLRIYFGTRDSQNRTLTTYLDVNPDNPSEVLYIHNKPVLELGEIGYFDDCGVMPSYILDYNNKKYLYYLGWNISSTVRYRVSNGLAISEDNGETFKRYSVGPIMDRTIIDPISLSTQSVMIDDGIWKMWYMSYLKWIIVDSITEPVYTIKYAESDDGINWNCLNKICIFQKSDTEAIARPFVVKEDGIFKMWYSYRKSEHYRKNINQSYRIGYAESVNGTDWLRKDEDSGIDVSESGWDSEMIAYPCIYRHNNRTYLIYNGNGFGRSGFGYAELEI